MKELEHILIMLLLLATLIRVSSGMKSAFRWLIVAVILLVFLAPAVPIALPWEVFTAVIIPLLLWQSAQRLGSASWFGGGLNLLLWLLLVIGIAGVIFLTGGLSIASALVFGLLAASLVWNTFTSEPSETILGQIGILTLVFLLTGVETAVDAPGRFLYALIAGGAVGALVGYLSTRIAERLPAGRMRSVFSVVQVYLAYGIGLILGLSTVAAAVVSVAMHVAYGTKRGLWSEGQIQPKPLDNSILFWVGVAALAFFGWQTHIPFSAAILLEVALALVLTAAIIWTGQRGNSLTQANESRPFEALFRVGFLLAAALLLWPKNLLLDPLPIAIALGFASLTAAATAVLLVPILNLFSQFADARSKSAYAGAAPGLLVKDLMQDGLPSVSPDTPIEQIAVIFAENGTDYVLVLDERGHAAGIITEADLFIKEERLPRTDVTYLALFQQPIEARDIVHAYRRMRGMYRAAEIMTRPVVTIDCGQPVDEAIALFVKYGYQQVPVTEEGGSEHPRVIGMLTRAGLIRRFFTLAESDPS